MSDNKYDSTDSCRYMPAIILRLAVDRSSNTIVTNGIRGRHTPLAAQRHDDEHSPTQSGQKCRAGNGVLHEERGAFRLFLDRLPTTLTIDRFGERQKHETPS